MELTLERLDDHLFVKRVDDTGITVVDRTLTRSFVLGMSDIVEDWPVTDVTQMRAEHASPILELEPEVVLLGTGRTQRFPPTEVLAAFLKRGVGLEAMDNAAAARTHSVLAGEGRRVVAAFILGS